MRMIPTILLGLAVMALAIGQVPNAGPNLKATHQVTTEEAQKAQQAAKQIQGLPAELPVPQPFSPAAIVKPVPKPVVRQRDSECGWMYQKALKYATDWEKLSDTLDYQGSRIWAQVYQACRIHER